MSRLETIATRQHFGRIRTFAFAALLAIVGTVSAAGLHTAVATTAPASAPRAQPAPVAQIANS